MRFLCLLIGEPPVTGPLPGSPEFAEMLTEFQTATAAMSAAGVLVDSGALRPPSSATMLRVRDGRNLVSDGPFAETKEFIGGYYVLDCPGLEEAIDWMATIPSARYGAVELRPLMTIAG